MLRQPSENPNNPSAVFLNGAQGEPKVPTPYITWSWREPPILILKGSKATVKKKRKRKEKVTNDYIINNSIKT